MGTVIPFRQAPATAVQLSAYPQDDGSALYVVEALHSDDTWDILETSRDKACGWKRAGAAAIRLNVPLLPKSAFPGRAA